MTAMPDHAPVITTLRPGVLSVNGPSGTTEYLVTGGFAEISAEAIAVLAEEAMPRADLTREFIDAKIAAAEEALANAGDDNRTAAAQRLNDLRGLPQTLGL
jgi:F-type H+-transporting ATPase subunit epsilon